LRPTPAETIAGIRRALREILETATVDDYARTRLIEIEAVLGRAEWDDAVVQVADENRAAARFVTRGLEWMNSDPRHHAHLGVDRDELDRVLAACRLPVEPLSSHNERGALCRKAVIELAAHLHDWVRAHPGDSEAGELLAQIRAHYATVAEASATSGQ
jgi:hypothetical protein